MTDAIDGPMGAVMDDSMSGHGRVIDRPWGVAMGGHGRSWLTAVMTAQNRGDHNDYEWSWRFMATVVDTC